MTRKVCSGPIRDKERTKMKLLRAVGSILKKEGFSGLSATNVGKKAGVNRKLVYQYFGGMENLVRDYLNSRDYWNVTLDQIDQIIEESRADFGRKTAYSLLENQFDTLMEDEEMRMIIHWGLSQDLKPLKDLNKQRERLGEELFSKVGDSYFDGRGKDIRAIYCLLVGGIYYVTLQAKMSGETICGIDINGKKGQFAIKETLKQILDWAYL